MFKENLRVLALVVVGSIFGSFVGCIATLHFYESRSARALEGIDHTLKEAFIGDERKLLGPYNDQGFGTAPRSKPR